LKLLHELFIAFIIVIICMIVGTAMYNVGASEESCKEHHNASTKICNISISAYGSNHIPKPLDFSYYYQTIGVKMQEVEPEICYIEPEDDYVRERFWDENWFSVTANAINEWRNQLQQETEQKEGWTWNFKFYLLSDHVDKNIYDREFRACNVFIFFERLADDGKLGQTGYYYHNSFFGYTVVTVYAETFTSGKIQIHLGDTPSESTVTRAQDLMEVSTENIGKITQHEFGHVFGLEHQYIIIGAPPSHSIMQPYLDPQSFNENRFITQNDVEAIIVLYGQDGFGGWNNPIKEHFIIIP